MANLECNLKMEHVDVFKWNCCLAYFFREMQNVLQAFQFQSEQRDRFRAAQNASTAAGTQRRASGGVGSVARTGSGWPIRSGPITATTTRSMIAPKAKTGACRTIESFLDENARPRLHDFPQRHRDGLEDVVGWG